MSDIKALALISGGLDSMLAAKVVKDLGIHVEGVNFFTGFCVEQHTKSIRHGEKPRLHGALKTAETIGIKLHMLDVAEEYKDVLIHPQYGYGANMNPCLDCKIFMVRKAKEWIEKQSFQFLITGEVVGQRPMSQRKDLMPIIVAKAGVEDILLRPLSAKNLPPTLPEREGWVDREALFDFSGRSRKPQIALAEKLGIRDYAQPAGGCCFLTDESYSKRLVDLWQARGERTYELDDIILLKVGRHIRPRPYLKLIIARDEGEVRFLTGYKKTYASLQPTSHAGALVLIDGELKNQDLELSAQIAARYSQGRNAEQVTLVYQKASGAQQELQVAPMEKGQIDPWLV